MFTLKRHNTRNVRLVALGAAASIMCAGSARAADSQDDVFWDPLGTGPSTTIASGGTGTFSNALGSFYNPRLLALQTIFLGAPAGDGTHPGTPGFYGDKLHFAGTAGTVTVNDNTFITQMSLDVAGYIFNGTGALQLGGGYGSTVVGGVNIGHYTVGGGVIGGDPKSLVVLTSTGDNTINNDLWLGGAGNRVYANAVQVVSGTLTVHNVLENNVAPRNSSAPGTLGQYSPLHKTGLGTMNVTGQFDIYGVGFNEVIVEQGTLNLASPAMNSARSNAGNETMTGVEVMAGATISGNGGIHVHSAHNTKQSLSGRFDPYFIVQPGAHLAPGNNTTGNFGAVGTFTINGGNSQTAATGAFIVTLAAGSNFDLDITDASTYDHLQLTGGGATSEGGLTIADGALINITTPGSLTPGTYHIITETRSGANQFTTIVHPGATIFTLGTVPSGFTYTFQDVITSGRVTGLDMIVVASALGGSGTWTATGGSSNWSDSTRWTPALPNGSSHVATFDGTGTLASVNVDGGKTVGGIAITNANGAVNYTISGSALTMDNGASNATVSSSAGTQTISSQLITSAASNLNVSVTGGSLTLGGIDNTNSKTVTLTANGGTLSSGPITNNGSLIVAGPGVVTVTGAVTGTGGVTLNGGTLILSATNNNYSGATTLNGGTLGGSGTMTGAVAAGTGAHTIAPSATHSSTSVNTLTVGSLTTGANTTLAVNLVAANTNDSIHVTGALDVTAGGTVVVTDNSVPQGYYKILQAGTVTGSGLSVSQVGLPSKEAYVLDKNHDAGFIDVHKVLIGDANADNIVDGADFDIWFTHLLATTNDYGQGDFTGDGLVDGADFDVWFTHLLNSFGGEVSSGFTGTQLSELSQFLSPDQMAGLGPAVPEPASLVVLGLGAIGLLSRRRK